MLCDCHWGFCEMPRFATHGPFNLGVAAMLWDTSTGTMSILSAAHLSDFHGISHPRLLNISLESIKHLRRFSSPQGSRWVLVKDWKQDL